MVKLGNNKGLLGAVDEMPRVLLVGVPVLEVGGMKVLSPFSQEMPSRDELTSLWAKPIIRAGS